MNYKNYVLMLSELEAAMLDDYSKDFLINRITNEAKLQVFDMLNQIVSMQEVFQVTMAMTETTESSK